MLFCSFKVQLYKTVCVKEKELYLQTQKITYICYFQILLKNSSLKMVKGKLWVSHSLRKGIGQFVVNQTTQLLLTNKISPWKEAEYPLLLQKTFKTQEWSQKLKPMHSFLIILGKLFLHCTTTLLEAILDNLLYC